MPPGGGIDWEDIFFNNWLLIDCEVNNCPLPITNRDNRKPHLLRQLQQSIPKAGSLSREACGMVKESTLITGGEVRPPPLVMGWRWGQTSSSCHGLEVGSGLHRDSQTIMVGQFFGFTIIFLKRKRKQSFFKIIICINKQFKWQQLLQFNCPTITVWLSLGLLLLTWMGVIVWQFSKIKF